jgi:hypothetical protein
MRGAVSIFQAVLIFLIAVSAIGLALPWFYDNYDRSLDVGEIQTVLAQMKQCNDKLVETARTGTASTCIFSANRGDITADTDGIYYALTTRATVCDTHNWVNTNIEKHIWEKCKVFDVETTNYELKWSWPVNTSIEGYLLDGQIDRYDNKIADINFDSPLKFITLTVLVEFESTPGQTGKVVEITRKAVEEENVILKVNIK